MSQVQPALQIASDLIVSEELFDEILRSEEKFCREIRKCDPRDAIINLVNGYKGAFDHIQSYLSAYSQPKILEIGSGNGFGLCYMLKCGLDVVGVEPGSEISFEGRSRRAISLLELNGITSPTSRLLPAYAEKLPFADNSFDLVFSIAVVEHVTNVEQTMREALRVVKPEGLVIMNVPNYNSFREGHYNILWIPYLLARKAIAKWYVRTVFHRQDYYVDELNFTTPRQFRKMAKALKECREMKIYRFCESPFAGLSYRYYERGRSLLFGRDATYRSLSAGEANTLRGIRTFRGRVRYGFHLTGPMLRFFFLGGALQLLSILGLAPTFNVVCSKQSPADSKSIE
jgi:SAM-dependent methyltransferase